MNIKEIKDKDIRKKVEIVLETFESFGVPMDLEEVIEGVHELHVHMKTRKATRMAVIEKFQKDLAYAIGRTDIDIQAPIPNKKLIGITIPNEKPKKIDPNTIFKLKEYTESKGVLTVPLGMTEFNEPIICNLEKAPHLLIAGSTGSGKSVFIHNIITALIKKHPPEKLRFIFADPKRVELTLYNDIPYLLTPVITEAKKTVLSLKWAAKEMDRRFDILQEKGVQDIREYHKVIVEPTTKNKKNINDDYEPMPYIVIVIDELTDFMASYPREIEAAIVRLAQMCRAVGIHLIIGTSRPSVQVITGMMKANIPTRIAFKTAAMIDSRVILDQSGAEKLYGSGDGLYLPSDRVKPIRFQAPFVTTQNVKEIVSNIIEDFQDEIDESIEFPKEQDSFLPFDHIEEDELDEMFEDVKEFIVNEGKASTSLIQRRFKIGYGRSARIMDQLETEGVVSPSDGTNKPRKVIDKKDEKIS